MSVRVLAVAIDCLDVGLMTEFWCNALDAQVGGQWTDAQGKRYVEIGTDRGGDSALLVLQPVDEHKQVKNRVHLDLAPVESTQEHEVIRLCEAGATIIDRAPGNPWIVLADPEGNEFCVLPPR